MCCCVKNITMTTTLDICNEIFESEEYIYILYGDDNERKSMLVDMFDRDFDTVTKLPFSLIEKSKYEKWDGEDSYSEEDEDCNSSENYLNTITLKLMISNYFVVQTNDFDNLSGGQIKELVHGDMFVLPNMMLHIETNNRKRKLIIITDLDPNNTIFKSDAGLRNRTKCIPCYNNKKTITHHLDPPIITIKKFSISEFSISELVYQSTS